MPPENTAGAPAFNPTELQQDALTQDTNQRAKLSLEAVVKIGEELEQVDAEIAGLNEQLAVLSERRGQLAEQDLPAALIELGLKGLPLANGVTISLEEVVNTSINDGNREEAHAWLRANGHGDLIKNELKIVFGKGEDEEAIKLKTMLREMAEQDQLKFGSVEQKEAVHPQTLKAQVRQWLKDGVPLPLETFKVFIFQRCSLERPKRAKV